MLLKARQAATGPTTPAGKAASAANLAGHPTSARTATSSSFPLAGASEPLDLDLGLLLGREAVVGMAWPMSDPMPVLQRPTRSINDLLNAVESLDKVREALFTIPNDCGANSPDYEERFTLCCAMHEATGGSDEGKELFAESTEQNAVFDEKFFEDRVCVWHYVKPTDKCSAAVTRGTLYARAAAASCGARSPQ